MHPAKFLLKLLSYAVMFALTYYLLRQVRKPSRWTGRLFLWIMNRFHSELTDWGLAHVSFEKNFTILDVGCGGGRTIMKLAALAADGIVCGIDYAEGSVAASRSCNSQEIKRGRVFIEQASVSNLPFPENKFDLVTAIETQYYWPDLVSDMREVMRVLKPAGTLIVIAEAYRRGTHVSVQTPVMKLLGSTLLGVGEERAAFSAAGYCDIQVFEEQSKGWICVTGRKPAQP